MKLVIQFLDDAGNIILEHKGSAEHPCQWKSNDKIKAGQYEIYAFSYQPHVKCLFPNGQPLPQAPPVSPFSGQLQRAPFADMPGFRSAPQLPPRSFAPPGRTDFKQQFKGDAAQNLNQGK